jgi:hypothetical protein
MRRLILPLAGLVLLLHAQTTGKFELTIDNIMRGPGLAGYEPAQVRWSGDRSQIFFQWKRATQKVSGMAILVVMTLKQTFLPGPVNVHRVMGGVAAYLLIGVTWAFGYKLLMEEVPDAIHFPSSFTGTATGEPARLMYFSFATLTTLSYGDAYPVEQGYSF